MQSAVSQYEMEHGINYIIAHKDVVIYTSRTQETNLRLGYAFEDREMQELHEQREEMKNVPNARVAGEPKADLTTLRLQGNFIYEDQEIFCLMALPMTSIENSVEILGRSNMWIALFAVVFGLYLALFFSKSITKPIREIEQVSIKLAELDFSKKANEQTSSLEMASLAHSINKMSSKLEENISELNVSNAKLEEELEYHKQLEEMQRDFMGNVSHEMKTPLALLQLYAANLKSDLAGIDREYYYDTMVEEASRLSDMVSSMLTMSSVESGIYEMNKEKFSFSSLCNNFAMKMEPLLEDFEVLFEIEPNLEVEGDAKYLEQAMKNYVTNATCHTPKGGLIKICAKREGRDILFLVQNEGEKIAREELELIWNRFYRSDKARIRGNHNVGLGLSIVKTIIEKHDGSCGVENIANGVLFFYRIPS